MSTHRGQFGLRAGFVAVAIIALALAALDAWLRGPYRSERESAIALSRLGARIILVDYTPMARDATGWISRKVDGNLFDMRVAAALDLSHSRVTDADLVHLKSFRHCGQIKLSDTRIGDAGLARSIGVFNEKYVDLSRTRVTDTSILFGNRRYDDHPLGLRLSGNRITRVFPSSLRVMCVLRHLDLSGSDADDETLAALPKGLNCLTHLDLSRTVVGDDGLDALVDLPSLTTLDLTGTRVTAEGVVRFKARFPGPRSPTVLTGPPGKVGIIPPYFSVPR